MANLRIDIASEFTGQGAFRKAEQSTNALEKSVSRLGSKIVAAFSAYKVAEFSKASVKAFAQDQRAAASLARTLENVNQGYQTDMVNNYISKTEALYGVLDDKLRPAFSQLVIATGDATKSQQLLQTALDISAGTGRDLESVAAALSKAYLGNNTALTRLGVGLSTASIKGKSFNDILSILNQNFAGQAATAADTYQGKIDKLNVAFKNMQETIGKGIIDAFSQLNADAGFNGVISKIGTLAQDISDILLGLGVIVGKLQSLPGAGVIKGIASLSMNSGIVGLLKEIGSKQRVSQSQPMNIKNFLADMQKIAAATAKQTSNAKNQLTVSKALTKEEKDRLALKKASIEVDKALGIFDMEKIQLQAAAMSRQSNEDYSRIQLKQDILALQDAINAGNVAEATRLAAVVEQDYKRVQAYQAINIAAGIQAGLITNIQAAATLIPKDMKLINLDNLNAALAAIQKIIDALNSIKMPTVGGAGGSSSITSVKAIDYSNANTRINTSTLAGIATASGMTLGTLMGRIDTSTLQGIANASQMPLNTLLGRVDTRDLAGVMAASAGTAPVINITVTDNAQKLVDVIMDTTQEQSASGISTRINRNSSGLNW